MHLAPLASFGNNEFYVNDEFIRNFFFQVYNGIGLKSCVL